MYAVEFQAMIQNRTIQVPYKYQQRFKKPVPVILLTEQEEESRATNSIEELFGTVPYFEPLKRARKFMSAIKGRRCFVDSNVWLSKAVSRFSTRKICSIG